MRQSLCHPRVVSDNAGADHPLVSCHRALCHLALSTAATAASPSPAFSATMLWPFLNAVRSDAVATWALLAALHKA
ncbi:hypothetical protein E2562_022985 [Oryza meyeriana var. granulata]|uniref:Uncharacterized protein n=1 Tax=Oryza meyeriana var. granulata TaxID=110450 RepID=A0A6G1EYA7_9ORYZ|nr:hypothetical protein E2562_022985 [Oryza meyeriana var. granulata]